jgi:hypothetical protein
MKFRLLGNQDLYLDESAYWTQGTKRALDGFLMPPDNGILDWSEQDLKELMAYADTKADALASGGEMDSSLRTEINSLRALAKRLRKTLGMPDVRYDCLRGYARSEKGE